jgi:hypothetical protein
VVGVGTDGHDARVLEQPGAGRRPTTCRRRRPRRAGPLPATHTRPTASAHAERRSRAGSGAPRRTSLSSAAAQWNSPRDCVPCADGGLEGVAVEIVGDVERPGDRRERPGEGREHASAPARQPLVSSAHGTTVPPPEGRREGAVAWHHPHLKPRPHPNPSQLDACPERLAAYCAPSSKPV